MKCQEDEQKPSAPPRSWTIQTTEGLNQLLLALTNAPTTHSDAEIGQEIIDLMARFILYSC